MRLTCSILTYESTKQIIYTQMRWHDAALINCKLKAKIESLSRNEIMNCGYEYYPPFKLRRENEVL
jgi:hypothetical protein